MGGLFSSDAPNLNNYVSNDQLNSKGYINKDTKELSNYYNKDYINTNYITNNQLTSKNYIIKDVNDLSNYYNKDYINTNYITNNQLTSKNYITKDVNDLSNYYNKNYINTNYTTNENLNTSLDKYQLKGNYLKYSGIDKNTIDFESDYLEFKDKNSKRIIKMSSNKTSFETNVDFNNEINIGSDNNYFNIKKDNNCINMYYIKNTEKIPVYNWCYNPNNSPNSIPNRSNTVNLENIIYRELLDVSVSIYTGDNLDSGLTDTTSLYLNSYWNPGHMYLSKIISEMAQATKTKIIGSLININIDISKFKQFLLEKKIVYPELQKYVFVISFYGSGENDCKFKVNTSNEMNGLFISNNSNVFLNSSGKNKDGKFYFYDDGGSSDILYRTRDIQGKFVHFIAITFNKLLTCEKYITISLTGKNSEFILYDIGADED
jgi:hypothetical protein